MSETIVEVTRKLTFWVGPPIDKIASNSRRPVDLFPGRPNSVSDEVLAEIAKDPRQGPIFDSGQLSVEHRKLLRQRARLGLEDRPDDLFDAGAHGLTTLLR